MPGRVAMASSSANARLGRWSFNKRALDEHCSGGPLAFWVIHDLRRSAATKMAEMGVAPHIVEAIVDHVGGGQAGVCGGCR